MAKYKVPDPISFDLVKELRQWRNDRCMRVFHIEMHKTSIIFELKEKLGYIFVAFIVGVLGVVFGSVLFSGMPVMFFGVLLSVNILGALVWRLARSVGDYSKVMRDELQFNGQLQTDKQWLCYIKLAEAIDQYHNNLSECERLLALNVEGKPLISTEQRIAMFRNLKRMRKIIIESSRAFFIWSGTGKLSGLNFPGQIIDIHTDKSDTLENFLEFDKANTEVVNLLSDTNSTKFSRRVVEETVDQDETVDQQESITVYR